MLMLQNKYILVSVLAVTSLYLTACSLNLGSGSDQGASLRPLSSSEKEQILAVSGVLSEAVTSTASPAVSGKLSEQDLVDLKSAVASNCTMLPQVYSPITSLPATIERSISGAGCPISYQISGTISGELNVREFITSSSEYKLLDASFLQKAELLERRTSVSGEKVAILENGNKVGWKFNQLKISISASTKSYGQVTMDYQAVWPDSGSGNASVVFKFRNITAILNASGNSVTINGQAASESDLAVYSNLFSAITKIE